MLVSVYTWHYYYYYYYYYYGSTQIPNSNSFGDWNLLRSDGYPARGAVLSDVLPETPWTYIIYIYMGNNYNKLSSWSENSKPQLRRRSIPPIFNPNQRRKGKKQSKDDLPIIFAHVNCIDTCVRMQA
ncbi:hypothetical protein ACJX0J_011134, partial [Zea mays]